MIDGPPETTAPAAPAVIIQAEAEALYRAGVADRLSGRPGPAVAKLEQVLILDPAHVDARLNLGLALLALGRLDAAEAQFRQVLVQAPGYTDARDALERIETRRAGAGGEPVWRLEASASRSRLSGGLPDWTEARISAARRLDEQWTVSGGVEATERFGARDVFLDARIDRRFAGGGVYIGVGGAPDADFRPEIAVTGGGQWRIAPGLDATLDASAARYATGTVLALHPGLAAELAGGRVQLAARWINVRDETGENRQGYTAQARWQVVERVALRLGYADAPESSDGTTVDVTAWNAGADIGLTDRLVLRVGYLEEDRQAYDREEVSLGLGWRF